jgi:hypothetical protein
VSRVWRLSLELAYGMPTPEAIVEWALEGVISAGCNIEPFTWQ